MKRFSCGDVVPGCQASWIRNDAEEILREVAVHAQADHGLGAVPDELVAAVRAKITTA